MYACVCYSISQSHSYINIIMHSGGDVVHSYGRLIPHEFPITDLQQISGPDGMGRITCTVSSGTPRFIDNSGNRIETGGVSQTKNGATGTLVVNPSNIRSFQNRDLYCTNIGTTFFYLFISSTSKYTSLSSYTAAHCALAANQPFSGRSYFLTPVQLSQLAGITRGYFL